MEPARITVQGLKARLDRSEKIFIIDTRSPDSWYESGVKIPGAVRIHFADLERKLGEVPRDRAIVTYCT
jgi:rhodanese-related sulfurtransferase